MIPYNTITAWGITHPWSTREQLEQDMLLSRAICEIFSNEVLAGELVFRGGTALNKLILDKPYRYSEDLDFVRKNPGGIGIIMRELTDLGNAVGFQVKTKMGKYPKVYWHCRAQTGLDLKIKIEINTFERATVLPVISKKHEVRSDWYTGEANAYVVQYEEIAATKIRALYQRSKGRDLFDLWLLTNEVGIDTALVCNVFSAYKPDGYSSKIAIANLEEKLQNKGFRADIDNLISGKVRELYNPDVAGKMIVDKYLMRL